MKRCPFVLDGFEYREVYNDIKRVRDMPEEFVELIRRRAIAGIHWVSVCGERRTKISKARSCTPRAVLIFTKGKMGRVGGLSCRGGGGLRWG